MKASDFDGSEGVIDLLDLEKTSRPGLKARPVNVNFPAWMVQSLGKEARRFDATRQVLVKLWLADKLD
jgi:hypothetical protein